MRGRYYPDDFINPARVTVSGPFHVTGIQPESTEDRNARENAAKQAAGDGPQIIVSPETPSSGADIRAIVRAVALRILESELDYHGIEELRDEHYPELTGIEDEQIRRVIREELA
jgi:sugar/nucleoside kinase (ribokinase family)